MKIPHMSVKWRFFLRFFAKLCIAIWQVVRGAAAILLMIFLVPLMVAIFFHVFGTKNLTDVAVRNSSTDSPSMVCGKLSGVVIEVPRKYVMFWPEYEGKNSWEKGFTDNKKGCDANLTSLALTMSWPDLQPVSLAEYSAQSVSDFDGVLLSLKPAQDRNEDIAYALDGLLRQNSSELEGAGNYIPSLELYFFEKERFADSGSTREYLWSRGGSGVPVFFICDRWAPSRVYTSCHGFFKISEIGVFAEITIARKKMNDWRSVVASMKKFTLSKIKSEY